MNRDRMRHYRIKQVAILDEKYAGSSSSSSGTTGSSQSQPVSSWDGQTGFRVLLIGLVLSLLHLAGILVSVYFLAMRLAEPDMPEKPVNHVCTTVVLCPLYRYVGGLAGITVQLAGSVLGLTVNLLLLLGVLAELSWVVLLWLLCYCVAICGCIVLFGVMLNALMAWDYQYHDVHYSAMLLTVVPLLIFLVYVICWWMVLQWWRQLKKRETQVFVCVE